MRIDAHQHFWRYAPATMGWITPAMEVLARDWLPSDVEPELAREHIDASIAVQSSSDEGDTAFLMQQVAAYPWIAGVVGWVDLRSPDCSARIEYWRAQGPLVGLRHQVQDEADPSAFLQDAAFAQGVQSVQQAGLVYELLLQGQQLESAAAFCQRHDRHVLVIDHLGKPNIRDGRTAFDAWKRHMRPIADMPHVALKLSGLVTEAPRRADGVVDADAIVPYLDTAAEWFGVERLLFGSDWPVCLLASPLASVHHLVRDWSSRWSDSEQAALYGGNAARLYARGLRLSPARHS